MLSDTTVLTFPPDGQAPLPLIFDPLLPCACGNLGNGALARFALLTHDYGRSVAWATERKG